MASPPGLAPLSVAGPGQPIEAARGDVLALLSDEAKALVLGEMMDLRAAVVRVDGTESARLRLLDSAIRRVTRGLWRYEMRRVDCTAQGVGMTFDEAFEKLIGHEGGYVNHPSDPGGETKYGISKRSYPAEDIAGLTQERAKAIYRRDFWGPVGCDALPDAVRFDLFDMAVNSGVKAAVKMLQAAVGEMQDGMLGPKTLQAAQRMPAARIAARFNGLRLEFMASLPTWPAFGRGWARRIAENLQNA